MPRSIDRAVGEIVAAVAPTPPPVTNPVSENSRHPVLQYERTFGIEIECLTGRWTKHTLADAIQQRVSNIIITPHQYTGFSPTKWLVKTDASCGLEVVSPPLRGDDGLRQVAAVLRSMKTLGLRVNERCGIHIHVGVSDIINDATKTANLARMILRYEDIVYHLVNSNRDGHEYTRRHNERRLRRIAKARTVSAQRHAWYGEMDADQSRRAARNHYHHTRKDGANFHSAWYRETLEYRYFNSTLNDKLVLSWVTLMVTMTEYAWKMRTVQIGGPSWFAKPVKKRFKALIDRLGLRHYGMAPFHRSVRKRLKERLELRLTRNNRNI